MRCLLSPFKSNSITGKARHSEVWKRMFHWYSFNQSHFMASCDKRSNVESTFSMIRAKFGDCLSGESMGARNRLRKSGNAHPDIQVFIMSRVLLAILVTSLLTAMPGCKSANATAGSALPNPVIDAPLATTKGEQTAVIAGGCFWGVQAVFEHVKGVISVRAGYSGGSADTAHYEMVSAGNTGHAESVRIKYDPSRISYGQLLKVYFAVAHDPPN